METLVQENLYFVLIVIGAVVVGIQASKLFKAPLPEHDFSWSNEIFDLRDLCGKQRFAAGYLAYLGPILLIYLLLAVSPDLLTLSMGIAGTTASVGAMTVSGTEAQTLSPILAATAVVALWSIEPVARLERSLRSVGHDIAGVPQEFQDIAAHIQKMDLRQVTSQSAPGDSRSEQRWKLPMLGSDIKAIQVFHKWTFGDIGAELWTGRSALLLDEVRSEMFREYDLFMRKFASKEEKIASIGPEDTDSMQDDRADEEERSIVQLAHSLRLQYTRLLAVAITNEKRPRRPSSTPEVLWELITDVRASLAGSKLIGVLATSTLVSFVVVLLFATLFYLTLGVFTGMAPENLSLIKDENRLLIKGLPIGEFYMSTLIAAFNAAMWDITGLCLLFFCGCATGIAVRAARARDSDWSYCEGGYYPLLQYAIVALLATVTASFAYVFFLFIKLVAWPSAMVAEPAHFASMLKDFGNSYLEFGFLSLLAAPMAVLICLLSDQLEKREQRTSERDRSTATLVTSFALIFGTLVPLLVRMQIGEVHDLLATCLALVFPITTVATLAGAFWILGHRHNHFESIADKNKLPPETTRTATPTPATRNPGSVRRSNAKSTMKSNVERMSDA